MQNIINLTTNCIFFEHFTDTVFTVSMDSLQPKFILQNGETENGKASDFSTGNGKEAFPTVENIFESGRYLFFKIRVGKTIDDTKYFYGLYDKKERTTSVSSDEAGIINDTDNFIALKFYSANANNEIIGAVDAYEVKLWFNENPDKAAQLPPELQKLKNIKETDNPVVMIARLKE